MLILLIVLLALLVILSVCWFRDRRARGLKAWTLIGVLAAALFCSAVAPPVEPLPLYLFAAAVALIGALGGSAPATYFVGLLKAPAGTDEPRRTNLTGKLGPLPVTAEIPSPPPQRSVDGGGRLIGIFERLAVVLAITTGHVEVLAVVVAVKGLARYPDIQSGHLTAEKFIVGTFASLLWAALSALIVINLLP